MEAPLTAARLHELYEPLHLRLPASRPDGLNYEAGIVGWLADQPLNRGVSLLSDIHAADLLAAAALRAACEEGQVTITGPSVPDPAGTPAAAAQWRVEIEGPPTPNYVTACAPTLAEAIAIALHRLLDAMEAKG